MSPAHRLAPSLPAPGRMAAVVAAAVLLNLVPIALLGDARVLLGPFLIMPLVLALPRPWAVVAAAIPASLTLVTLHHPFVLLLAALEAAWLASSGDATSRRVLLRWATFWVVVGVPLGVWLYRGVAGLPDEIVVLWLGSRACNQFCAVVVGHFLLQYTPLFRWARREPAGATTGLRALVFNYVFILAAVPLVLTALVFSSLLRREAEEENALQLQSVADRVAEEIGLFLKLHLEALTAVANLAQRAPDQAALFLEEQHRAHGDLITMLIADRSGRIEATAPAEALERLRGNDISDREYFQAARDSMRSQISGVFRGRGFGDDLLIGLSVPVLAPSGEFHRLVQGSVEIGRLARITTRSAGSRSVHFVLFDRAGRVIFADEELPVRTLESVASLPIFALRERQRDGAGISYDVPVSGKLRRVRAYGATDTMSGITVVVQRPLLATLSDAGLIYVLLAAVFAGVLVTSTVVARLARRRLSSPLEHFAASAERQAQEADVAPITPPAVPGVPQEVALVFASFNRLAERLHQAMVELRHSNAELDQRVELRTRELEAARRVAEAASESKTRFLAMTSHEIRTPLNAIIGFADSLLEQVNDPLVVDRLRTIRSSGVLLLGVVNDLLDLSSVEAGRLQLRPGPCEIDALCRDLARLFSHRAEQKRLRLEYRVQPVAPSWVVVDAQRLRQVLTNLLGNAVKFTSSGCVSLDVSKQAAPGGRVRLAFAVTDTGPGIAAERQARLFEAYYRVEELHETPGTGLGLNISRRLVELMGGTIKLESVPGVGSRFSFAVVADVVDSPAPATTPVAELRVLVVDDHPANQEVLRAMLEGRCSTLEVAASAEEALACLTRRPFDVALIDLEMPGIDGFQLMERLRADPVARGPCRGIAVSAHPRAQLLARCRAVGFDDYVEKPIDRRLLWQVLTGSGRGEVATFSVPPMA